MTQQLQAQGLAWQRVGIDLRQLDRPASPAQLAARFPPQRFDVRLRSGVEVGCRVSHLTAWQGLLASAAPSLTAIEDDLALAQGVAAAGIERRVASNPCGRAATGGRAHRPEARCLRLRSAADLSFGCASVIRLTPGNGTPKHGGGVFVASRAQ